MVVYDVHREGGITMQCKQKLVYITLGCMIPLSGVVLLINVRTQVPEQGQIVFASDRDGNWEIYVMDADGINQHNLTNNPAEDMAPDWFDPAFARIITPVSLAGKVRALWGKIKAK